MRIIISYLIILLFYTTNLFGQIAGTYAMGGDVAENFFCFNNNGTYTFINKTDLDKTIDKGTYKKIGDTLVLNSNIQVDDILQVKEWKITGSDSLFISVRTLSGNEPILTTLVINDTFKYTLSDKDKNGIIKFKKGFVKTIKVNSSFLTWKAREKIIMVIKDNNIIEIFFDDTKGYRGLFLKDEKYIFKKTYIQSVKDKDFSYTYQENFKCNE